MNIGWESSVAAFRCVTGELKTLLEFGQLRADNVPKMKDTHAALAIEPDRTRYARMRATG